MIITLVSSAWACGGLFCDAIQPVDQAGEQIVFSVDSDAGTTTMHVEIAYEGPSAEFAWVLPVQGVPDLEISSKDLFDVLAASTAPRVGTSPQFGPGCAVPDFASDSDTGTPGEGGVQLLGAQTVGPYDTQTLAATDAEVLVTYLQDNGYAVPDLLTEALAPYVGSGMNFLALRLSKDNDAGDLRPLALTYADETPVIPIVLTRVAAQPDMPITVYLLGDARAVPSNYLHVRLNPLHLDYWSFGSNYDEVVTAAADEAGGQAFATDLSASTEMLDGLFYTPDGWNAVGLGLIPDPQAFVQELWNRGFPASEDLVDILRDKFPLTGLPDGVADTDAYSCPDCWPEVWTGIVFDPVGSEMAVQDFVTQRMETQEWVRSKAWITRLRSSMSAEEMTVDPTFTTNADMPQEFDNQWVVTVTQECGTDGDMFSAPQHLAFRDGFEVTAPSQQELDSLGLTLHQWLQNLAGNVALVIEETGPTGAAIPVRDDSVDLAEQLAQVRDPTVGGTNCGCASSQAGMTGLFGALLLPLATLLRRRS